MSKQPLTMILIVLAASMLILGCGDREETTAPEGAAGVGAALDAMAAGGRAAGYDLASARSEWGYDGEHGPDHWCDLDDAFFLCCEGMAQSPIDLVEGIVSMERDLAALSFHYPRTPVEVENNGHTIEAMLPAGADNYIMMGGKRFDLVQFHFHAPSEHLVNGHEFAMEAHLVHQAADGALAVVGVLIEEGKPHTELAKFWGELPHEEGELVDVPLFKVAKFLKRRGVNDRSFRYSGSLTTPPCSESVTWIILSRNIEMSSEQIAAFVDIFSGDAFPHGNRRPVQEVNGRIVRTDGRRTLPWNDPHPFVDPAPGSTD